MSAKSVVATLVCALALLGAEAVAGGQPYLLGGGDSLQVNVWKNPELSQAVVVRPDGMITLPLIRDVPASGRTAMDLARAIEEKLSAFVNAPNVTVTVAAATNYRVSTYGAVANNMFTLSTPLNAQQLLARAGGPAEDADLGGAYIQRRGATIPVDLQVQAEGAASAPTYPELLPDDVLVVPFRKPTRRVLVVGEVRKPSNLPFREGMTLLDAFVAAGGGTDYADLEKVRVFRNDREGRWKETAVDLERVLTRGDLGQNLGLLAGDVVVVPR